MSKILTDFDAIAYRNRIEELKTETEQEYLKQKGTIKGVSWESMKNAFEIALQEMENFATFKES